MMIEFDEVSNGRNCYELCVDGRYFYIEGFEELERLLTNIGVKLIDSLLISAEQDRIRKTIKEKSIS